MLTLQNLLHKTQAARILNTFNNKVKTTSTNTRVPQKIHSSRIGANSAVSQSGEPATHL